MLSFKNHAENEAGRLVPDLFMFFLKKSFIQKQVVYFSTQLTYLVIQLSYLAQLVRLSFNIFRQPSAQYTIKTNCIKLQTIETDICSKLIFQERVWEQHILRMSFQEKSFSCYILFTDQISLSECCYFFAIVC